MERRKPVKVFDDDQLYSPKQISQKAKVHVVTVHKWRKQGRIRLHKVGPNTTRGLGSELNEDLFPAG